MRRGSSIRSGNSKGFAFDSRRAPDGCTIRTVSIIHCCVASRCMRPARRKRYRATFSRDTIQMHTRLSPPNSNASGICNLYRQCRALRPDMQAESSRSGCDRPGRVWRYGRYILYSHESIHCGFARPSETEPLDSHGSGPYIAAPGKHVCRACIGNSTRIAV